MLAEITNNICLALYLLYGLENIGFEYPSMSMIVIRQRPVQSDVWCLLTCIDDDFSCIMGSKYLEYNPGLELNIFLFITNNEQKNYMKTKIEQDEEKSNNNNKIIRNTGMRTLYTK